MQPVLNQIYNNPWIFFALTLWELTWKGFALWYSARNKQLPWFIAVLVINSVGILPIIYILLLKYYYKKNTK
jgi:hypothetical protein